MQENRQATEERPKKSPPPRPNVHVPDIETDLDNLKPLPVHSEPPEKTDSESDS